MNEPKVESETERNEPDALLGCGFTVEQAEGLEAAWHNSAITAVLSDTAARLHRGGYTASEVFDAVAHGLDADDAVAYATAGFTFHQGALIKASDQAQENYYGRPGTDLLDFPPSDIDTAYMTASLLACTSFTGVDIAIRDYRAARDLDAERGTGTQALDEVRDAQLMLAAMTAPDLGTCPCNVTSNG